MHASVWLRSGASTIAFVAGLGFASAKALTITETGDANTLAGTLFLNVPGLTQTGAKLSFGGDTSTFYPQAGRYFNATGTYGLPTEGIVFSTGNVNDYGFGPNLAFSNTSSFATSAAFEQNELLAPITGRDVHFDVVQLDISFFNESGGDSATFFATFGSEEFPEFVGSDFVDGFGLFVNGVNAAGVLPTGGSPGDTLLPVNIDHPDFRDIAGTELDGVLAPNGNPVLRFDVPIVSGDNTFTIILADATDSSYDTTVYLSSFIPTELPPDGVGSGETEFNPLLPSNPPDPLTGEFIIELPADLEEGETVWIDPPVSVGFVYTVIGGALFSSVTAPSGATIADLDGYFITVGATTVALGAGGMLDFFDVFGVNPTTFTLSGIDPELMLDPEDAAAFPLGIALDDIVGTTTISMIPIVEDFDDVAPVPLPASAVLYLGAMAAAGVGLVRRRRAQPVAA